MSDQIDKMAESFKTIEELRAYSKAQYQTILSLNQKLNKLEKENSELKNRIVPNSQAILVNNDLSSTDPETICVTQLFLLKEKALISELTYEECKKVSEYTKILSSIQEKKKKDISSPTDKLENSQLLQFLEDVNAENK